MEIVFAMVDKGIGLCPVVSSIYGGDDSRDLQRRTSCTKHPHGPSVFVGMMVEAVIIRKLV